MPITQNALDSLDLDTTNNYIESNIPHYLNSETDSIVNMIRLLNDSSFSITKFGEKLLAEMRNSGAEFVAAVRHAFEWAGFPGWAGHAHPPERELAWLRSRLLPL